MTLRIGTFNIENLLTRFDFSGFRNQLRQDRVLQLFTLERQNDYQQLEAARLVGLTDDIRQMSGLAIADTDADILCLQEVESLEALNAFEYGYLYRMVGESYRHKFVINGNDSRGIDVAVMVRERTRAGEELRVIDVKSHAGVTFRECGLLDDALAANCNPDDKIFRRDCLEIDIRVAGRPLTVYVVHFKSMTNQRDVIGDGRATTMALRRAEAKAVRRVITNRFPHGTGNKNFVICGDMNDYQERVIVSGNRRQSYEFRRVREAESALDIFTHDQFVENPMDRRPELDRWTLFHTRGPGEQHLAQLDYIFLSPALARANPDSVPEIVRAGQPYRTPFPPGQEVERYPRVGWDRPKASDHCPVVMELRLP